MRSFARAAASPEGGGSRRDGRPVLAERAGVCRAPGPLGKPRAAVAGSLYSPAPGPPSVSRDPDPIVVPFAARVDAALARTWLDELGDAFAALGPVGAAGPGVVVRGVDDLDARARAAARVAIVSDPDPAALAALPALEWIQSLWAGVETLLAGTDARVDVVRLVDPGLTRAMAEAALAWTLYLHRDMPRYLAQQRERVWTYHELVPAAERRVGVLGLGELGAASARALAAAGFDVAGWSRSAKSIEGIGTFSGEDGLGALLERSDVLVVLLPLTDATRGLLDGAALDRLPAGASIVNAARGPIVVEADLLERLDAGRIDHAVLDVFDIEPLPQDHPFWTHPRVTVMPHVAAPTPRRAAARVAAGAVHRWLATGERPPAVDRRRGY